MNQTEDIKELVAALSKAQGVMMPAKFNRVNPHFKNRYADFKSCMDACREPLANNGLSILQYCELINEKLNLVTMLAHTSGQWIKSYFPLNPSKMDSQGIGSAMTYGKRYSLSAMLGIVSDEEEDDDGEASQGRGRRLETLPSTPLVKPRISLNQVSFIRQLEKKLDEECKAKLYAWMKSAYQIETLEEIPNEVFQKVLASFENAVKFMEQQQKLEVANV